jgi:hypothetical protein
MAADQETALGAKPSPASRSAVRVPSDRRAGASVTTLLVAILTLLALVLRLYQLTRPGQLLGVPQYDDGVYLGSAIRLLDGYAPYRDFAFVQPPGIVLLAVPLALLAKLTGSASAMAVARVLTACVGAATVALAGLLVRHRGAVAVTLVCGILAVHPGSVKAASTLFLEPWLVLFCLLGALAVFEGDQPTLSRRRLVLGGLAIGFAGAVKAFALFPALALLVVLAMSDPGPRSSRRGISRWRRSGLYVGGVIAGFAIPILPFAALAPRRFLYDVIVDQYQRTDLTHVSLTSRLSYLFGLQYFNLSSAQITAVVTLIVAVVLACIVAASLFARRPPSPLDCFALTAAAAVFAGLLLPADFYWHYAAAFAPFLALLIGLSVARLIGAMVQSPLPRAGRGTVTVGVVLLTAIAAIAAMTGDDVRQEHLMTAYRVRASVDRVIPSGACVLTDNPSLTIMANRFVSDVPGCSPLVDSLGTDLSLGAAHNALNGAGRYPAVRKAWLSAFRQAQYVWLYCYPPTLKWCDLYTNRRIPWTPAIRGYFQTHFHRSPSPKVFVRDGLAKDAS